MSQETVLAAIKAGAHNGVVISRSTGIPYSQVFTHLRRLEAAGKVYHAGHNCWKPVAKCELAEAWK